MKQSITYVGIDAHKKSHQVAMLLPGRKRAEVWDVANEPVALKKLVRKLERAAPGEVQCVYEAGPCGFSLQRELEEHGLECMLAAPSLIPVKPGERVKTDRRDAAKLAGLLRAGMLTAVHPPTPDEEAVRDLCRCREDARHDITRARHRMSKFLLRHGLIYREGRAWTRRHANWLRRLQFQSRAHEVVFADYLQAIEGLEERIASVDAKIESISLGEPYAEPVGRLRCFRGIDTVTAMTLVSELHGFERFTNPRQLMAFLGLVPSERSSGERKTRGGITKTGNGHARRVLIEAAWNQRHRPGRRRMSGSPSSAKRDRAKRHGLCEPWTRVARQRRPPTEHGHAALPHRVIREYQSDSWSDSVCSVAVYGPRGPTSKLSPKNTHLRLDGGSLHISPRAAGAARRCT